MEAIFIKNILNNVKNIIPLYKDIKVDIKIVENSLTNCERGQEYCILFYSEKKDNYIQNIGFIGERLDLYLVDNNINSMMDFMNPLLINNDIIINQGLNKFIKNQTLNNFLISHKVIGENEIFLLPSDEESLIDINQLVAEIDQAKPLLNEFEEKREKLINDVLNDISDN